MSSDTRTMRHLRESIAAPGGRRIDLKLLLVTAVGDEPSFLAARSALDRIGAPYDVLIAATTDLTAAMLSSEVDHCNYRGVVIAVGGLGFADPITGVWASAFTAAEWTTLADFERACSARELVWYGWPGAEFGLGFSSSFGVDQTVIARITTAGAGVFPYVQTTAAIPIQNAYGYLATVTDPATTALVETGDGYTLVAERLNADGRETMIATVDSNPNLVHGLALETGLVSWVSRDLYIGKKRAYLSPQVDDLFLDNDGWNVDTHSNPADGSNLFRITGDDLTSFLDWQGELGGRLPEASTYITALAFNGVGTSPGEFADQTLFVAAQSAGARVTWLDHTWDHENMDLMSRAAARTEVRRNCSLATRFALNGFSCTELVTPEVSGLNNLNAVRGLLDAGATCVVSDTSITAMVAAERGTTPGDNPSFNVGRDNAMDARLYEVPRHPTSIFYDASTRAAEIDEYNTIYRSYWGRDLSYDEIIAADSQFGLHYLLTGDIDPLMFHQGNLQSELVDGTRHTLLGDWIETSTARFAALVKLPILTLAQRDIAHAMRARAALDACDATATYVEGGAAQEPDSILLSSTGACAVPITGVASMDGQVETYANIPTTEISMTPGVVKVITLPSNAASRRADRRPGS
jgi:hypothetical protein